MQNICVFVFVTIVQIVLQVNCYENLNDQYENWVH